MNYWQSLLLLSIWLVLLTACGRMVTGLLPKRGQRLVLRHLSLILGLAVHVLLATAVGWCFGTRTWIAVPLITVVTIFAILRVGNFRQFAKESAVAVLVGVVVSLGPLFSVYLFHGYNVYNDTFTYLVHAQWLQNHPFKDKIIPAILQPAYTQVALYQYAGFRMGASFFLGWMQAASPFHWSIYVYPATICIALVAGARAIGGIAAALSPRKSSILPLLWSMAAGTTISGFTFGCFMGFLPQIFGLASAAGFVALLILFYPGAPRQNFFTTLPLALLLAALGFAYSELFPFAILTLIAWFLIQLVRAKERRRLFLAAAGFVFWLLLLLNAEFLRIAQALTRQINAVVGWPVPWSIAEFVAHALGLHSGLGDGNWWLLSPNASSWLALTGLALVAAVIGVQGWRNPTRIVRWSAPIIFLSIVGFFFVRFRYFTPSPWPVGTGQTWNQFKLSNWGSPILLAVLGATLIGLGRDRLRATLVGTIMLGWIAINLHGHFYLTPDRISETRRLTGGKREPFSVYETMRRDVLAARPQGTIFLDLSGSQYKSRQIAAYFLHDLPVAADWTGDSYIVPHLPSGWQSLSPSNSRWWIYQSPEPGPAADGRLFVLATPPQFLVTPQEITGGYGTESDATGWWVWTPRHVHVRLKVYSMLPAQVCLKFIGIAAASPRKLTITCYAKSKVLFSQTLTMNEGWQSYASAPFRLEDSEVEIEISSHSTPVPIGASDSRQVTFLAKNVRLDLVRPAP